VTRDYGMTWHIAWKRNQLINPALHDFNLSIRGHAHPRLRHLILIPFDGVN